MPIGAIIAIIVVSLYLISSAIIHRHVLQAIIKHEPRGKAPKWHVWLPKKMRME